MRDDLRGKLDCIRRRELQQGGSRSELEEGNWTLEEEEGWLDGGKAAGLGRRRLNEA